MMFRISAEITAGFKKRWICSAGNSNLFEKLMKRTSNLKQRWYCKLGDMKNPFFHHGPWCFFSLPNVELFRGRFVYRIHHDFYLPSLSLSIFEPYDWLWIALLAHHKRAVWPTSCAPFISTLPQVMNLPRLAKYYAELRITDELEHVRLLRVPRCQVNVRDNFSRVQFGYPPVN